MKLRKHGRATVWSLLLLVSVGACKAIEVPRSEPRVSALATSISQRSAGLFETLRSETAPECRFEAHAAAYSALRSDAAELQTIAAGTPNDGALNRGANGLVRALEGATRSHELASQNTGDPFGLCMAPRAITANADAIARATEAILKLQQERGL